jgi:hypothetical protein
VQEAKYLFSKFRYSISSLSLIFYNKREEGNNTIYTYTLKQSTHDADKNKQYDPVGVWTKSSFKHPEGEIEAVFF